MSVYRELREALTVRANLTLMLDRYPVPGLGGWGLERQPKSHKVSFIYSTAEWCAPCISYLESLRDTALEAFSEGALIARVDLEEPYGAASRFGVQRVPATLAFMEGGLVDSITCAAPEERLKSLISSYIGKALALPDSGQAP